MTYLDKHGKPIESMDDYRRDLEDDLARKRTPEEWRQHLTETKSFASEEFGFAQELAMHFGFEYIDDDATIFKCSAEQLYVLMKALGYSRKAREIRP